ncbi:MAG: hypothetical protein SGPRY_014481 [Prymnesium sp.]
MAPGSLALQFFTEGEWRRVRIDDRIPCNASGQPLYAHSVEPEEMWVALIEKAYAKTKGCYQALTSGFVDSALVELTGGAPQRVRFHRKGEGPTRAESVWATVSQWVAEDAPIGCAISLSGAADVSTEGTGLLQGHAYGVEQLREVAGTRLLQLRNPWGSALTTLAVLE